MAAKESVIKALRLSPAAAELLDSEIERHISTACAEMIRVGVPEHAVAECGPLIESAIVIYCMAEMGDPAKYERYDAAWKFRIDNLRSTVWEEQQ